MKHCPSCNNSFDNNDLKFCPECSRKGQRILLDEFFNTTDYESPDQGVTHGVKVGPGTLVEAPISNTTHIYTQPLTESEKIKKNKDYFAEECSQRCHNGFISEEDKIKLEQIREKIELERHFADDILKKALERSIKPIIEIPGKVQEEINDANKAILSNDTDIIKGAFEKMKVWKGKIANDTFLQMYFQLSSILEPVKYIDELTDASSEYWQEFWSYIAFKCISPRKAEEVFPKLTKWDTRYPRENQLLLSAIGYLMDANDAKATELFNSIGGIGFSDELRPIYETIDSLIGSKKNLIDINFYKEKLFKSSYDSHKAEWLEQLAQEKAILEKIAYQKTQFLSAFYEKKGNLIDAFQVAGITETTLNTWLDDDPEFHAKFADKKRLIEVEKEEQEAQIEALKRKFLSCYKKENGDLQKALSDSGISQEQFDDWSIFDPLFKTELDDFNSLLESQKKKDEEALMFMKKQFLSCYEGASCDMLKACAFIGQSQADVLKWRKEDRNFDSNIKLIKKKHKRNIHLKILKWLIPCIIIANLFVFIGSRILDAINQRNIYNHTEELYNEQSIRLENILSSIPNSAKGISIDKNFNSLNSGYRILDSISVLEKKLKLEKDEKLVKYKKVILQKADTLYEYSKGLGTTLPIVPNYKQIQLEGQSYMSKIDSLKQLITNIQ